MNCGGRFDACLQSQLNSKLDRSFNTFEGYMTKDLDHIWKALSDPTRREILDLLRDGPRQTTEIVDSFSGLSRFGVMKHLDVLREAGLVQTRSEGRMRINSLNAAPIREILERWIGKYEAYWSNTLLRVKESAESETASASASKRKPQSKRKGKRA
jgi:DNA-binding transcriptional ArsR family regulator